MRQSSKRDPSPRDFEVRFRVNEREYDAFLGRAEELGVSLSAWARMKLRRLVGLAPPDELDQ